MNLSVFIGPACLLAGMFIALYVKDKSREVAKKEFTENIVAALAVFKLDLLKSMGEEYRRSGECNLMMEGCHDRLDSHAKRLDEHDMRFLQIAQGHHRSGD